MKNSIGKKNFKYYIKIKSFITETQTGETKLYTTVTKQINCYILIKTATYFKTHWFKVI